MAILSELHMSHWTKVLIIGAHQGKLCRSRIITDMTRGSAVQLNLEFWKDMTPRGLMTTNSPQISRLIVKSSAAIPMSRIDKVWIISTTQIQLCLRIETSGILACTAYVRGSEISSVIQAAKFWIVAVVDARISHSIDGIDIHILASIFVDIP